MESREAFVKKKRKERKRRTRGKKGKQKQQENWLTHFETPCFVVIKERFSISNAQKRSDFAITTVSTSTLINSLFYAFSSKVQIFHSDIKSQQGKCSLPPAHPPQPSLPRVPLSFFSLVQFTSQLHQGLKPGDHPQPASGEVLKTCRLQLTQSVRLDSNTVKSFLQFFQSTAWCQTFQV